MLSEYSEYPAFWMVVNLVAVRQKGLCGKSDPTGLS